MASIFIPKRQKETFTCKPPIYSEVYKEWYNSIHTITSPFEDANTKGRPFLAIATLEISMNYTNKQNTSTYHEWSSPSSNPDKQTGTYAYSTFATLQMELDYVIRIIIFQHFIPSYWLSWYIFNPDKQTGTYACSTVATLQMELNYVIHTNIISFTEHTSFVYVTTPLSVSESMLHCVLGAVHPECSCQLSEFVSALYT